MTAIKAQNNLKEHRVFIVDDYSILREGLTELINREMDLTVCGEAGTVSGALQAIAACKPDIIIVDLTLKDGSGIRLIENILYSHPGILMLVLSLHDESVYAERCIKAGARGYIMKHESSGELISAIKKVLRGDIYVSRKLGAKFINKLAANKINISDSPLGRLTNREMEIYQLIGENLRRQEIAEKLNLSLRTVETYIEHIKKKMNFRDTHELITHAIKGTMKI
ncbi:MAG: response regulator transcription factor [Nitrospirae bacterium]|nr:response regulator transcription factor [Nitrospirota bacterium]